MNRSSHGIYFSIILFFCFWLRSIAGSLHDDDFRVVDKPIGDGRGHGGAVEDFSPVSERKVRSYDRRFFFVPGADDLEEEIGAFVA